MRDWRLETVDRRPFAVGARAALRNREGRLAWTLARLRNRVEEAACFAGASRRLGAVANTGWTNEARVASLEVRRAKARTREEKEKARAEMFEKQMKAGGKDFIEHWYPKGRDGQREDPHYGETPPQAPYGWIEGTVRPRTEPLYDKVGRPIIPRTWEEWHRPGPDAKQRQADWEARTDAAEKEWGRFGRKKQFLTDNPGATEEDWNAEEKRRLIEWIKQKRQEKREKEKKAAGAKGGK